MSSPIVPDAPKKGALDYLKNNWTTVLGVVLGLAAIGGGVYYYLQQKKAGALPNPARRILRNPSHAYLSPARNPSPAHKRLRALADGERGRLLEGGGRLAALERIPLPEMVSPREALLIQEDAVIGPKSNPSKSAQQRERLRAQRAAGLR